MFTFSNEQYLFCVQSILIVEVFNVESCPMSKESWESASTRLKCNSAHEYHCVPNKQFTSLSEFCYPKGPRFPFEARIHAFTLNSFTVIFTQSLPFYHLPTYLHNNDI